MSILEVPTEILLQIFYNAVGDGPLQPGGTAVAIPISQVSSRWRQISLDCPSLWTDVRFPYGAYRPHSEMLGLLLDRTGGLSGTLPLTVVFNRPEPGWAGRMVDFWPLFRRMRDFCHRFEAIFAILPTPGIYEFNRALGQQNFPLLVHLHVVQSDNLAPVAVDFENAHFLKSFHLEHISYGSESRNTSASLRSMRFVNVRFVDLPVSLMHGLHELTITRSPLPFFNHANPLPQIALTSLILDGIASFGYPNELFQFLTSFEMPHLQNLEVAHLDNRLHLSSQLVQALQPPAIFPALRSVKFTSLDLSSVSAVFCHALPALDTLVLVDVNPHPLLSIFRDDFSLCPALTKVVLDGVPVQRGSNNK
ncbi:hypothetical protein R3P38DRAFT_1117462 [Favolaschia claudopus]|uniref:F-box domain-containing protein n=1 Tax=Favolaschia claudopus TaxID=2862362 RepID=A0AAW0B9L8_9AGAR